VSRRDAIRLLVVDRRPVFARALETLLAQFSEFEVGDAADAQLVLLSGVAPRRGALASLADVRQNNPKAATLMLLEEATPSFVRSAHAAGVRGMLLENVAPDDLKVAMLAVHRGQRVFDPQFALVHRETRTSLSDRELEVLRLAGNGASPHAISMALNLSKSTTRTYLKGAIRKMGAVNRADAARAARDLGWFAGTTGAEGS